MAKRKVRVTYDALADLAELGRPDNPKGHNVPAIEESVGAVGYVEPVVVNDSDGLILSGHGRVEALLALRERGEPPPAGISVSRAGEWLVPTLHGVELSEEEAQRYVIAANQTTIAGGWMDADLEASLALLVETETGLVGTGFVEDDLAALRAALAEPEAGKTDPDDVPEAPDEPYVKRGDLYALGDHRLLCGDATSAEDVERLLDGEAISSIVTDPPYGIEREGVTNDSPDLVAGLYTGMLAATPCTNAVIASFHSPRVFPVWLDIARAAGLRVERMLWLHRIAYPNTRPWRGWIMASDAILLMSIGRPKWPKPRGWSHDTYQKTGREDVTNDSHATIKPVDVVGDLIAKLPQAGPVLDPFLGSGTTMIAAERLGRRCYGMEIEPRYVQVAIERWQNFTGKKAKKL